MGIRTHSGIVSESSRTVQDAAAAAQLELQERAQLESAHQAREAQAQADLTVARLLDSVSERTGQDVAELDRAAAIADHEKGATFECPILYIECDKVQFLSLCARILCCLVVLSPLPAPCSGY